MATERLAPMKLDNPHEIGEGFDWCNNKQRKMNILKVSDVFCYICRGVLIEPVTVPCLHVFCYTCFEQSMQETSYSCPLCRRRISNWVRTAKKTDKLINVELWTKIKEQFKDQVHSKLRGEDDGLDEKIKQECHAPISLSSPGEVAQEFKKLINDLQTEREKLKAAEELASKELISKLTKEEELELEALRRDNKLKAEMDEELARKIQAEINKEVPTSSNNYSSNQSDKSKRKIGPMDNFLKGNFDLKKKNGVRLSATEKLKPRSTSSDSTDSIQSEMHHFKPIKVVPRTPPKRHPDGQILEIALTKVKPLKLSNSYREITQYESKKEIVESKKIHSPYSAFIGKIVPYHVLDSSSEPPRRRLRSSSQSCEKSCQSDSGVLKEITLGDNSDSNSMGPTDPSHQTKKKKRNSPSKTKKQSQSNLVLFRCDSVDAETENSDVPQAFDTQDYLDLQPDIDGELIEEQRRIEQVILQEKADRELALKLSKEWEGRYELRKKPKQKATTAKRKTKGHENKKLKQTLIGSLTKTRGRNK